MTTKIPVELSSTPSIVDNGDATAITIDSSERIGIGTTSPASKLHIFDGGSSVNNQITFGNPSAAHNAIIHHTAAGSEFLNIECKGTTSGYGNIVFKTGGTPDERMRINSSGNVGIGTSSPAYFVHFNASSGGTQFQKQGNGPNLYEAWTNTGGTNYIGTNGTQWEFYVGATLKFQINSSGGSSVSDEKFKENIEDISYGLDTVKALKPRNFKWKDSQENDIGFIAQEVQPIINEIINEPLESPEGLENGMSMNYSALTAVLTKAIQEQQAIIEDLQTQINEVKNGN